MEWWMWTTMVGLVGGLFAVGGKLFVEAKRDSKMKEAFIDEAANLFGGGSSAIVQDEIEGYVGAKRTIFDVVKGPMGLAEKEFDLSQTADPKESWMRKLTQELSNPLKGRLLRRCWVILPRMHSLPNELQSKHQLLQRGLISEAQWSRILRSKDDLTQEAESIKFEAECLAENWGEQNGVFRDAQYIQHQQAQRAQQQAAQSAFTQAQQLAAIAQAKHQQQQQQQQLATAENVPQGSQTEANKPEATGEGPVSAGSAADMMRGGPELPATLAAFRQAREQAARDIMGVTPEMAEEARRQQIMNMVKDAQSRAAAGAKSAASKSVESPQNAGSSEGGGMDHHHHNIIEGHGSLLQSNSSGTSFDGMPSAPADMYGGGGDDGPDLNDGGQGGQARAQPRPSNQNRNAAKADELRQRLSLKKAGESGRRDSETSERTTGGGLEQEKSALKAMNALLREEENQKAKAVKAKAKSKPAAGKRKGKGAK